MRIQTDSSISSNHLTWKPIQSIVDEDEAIEMLRTEFEIIRKNDKSDTSLKRAVTYLDFRKMPKE